MGLSMVGVVDHWRMWHFWVIQGLLGGWASLGFDTSISIALFDFPCIRVDESD
jgi:hypothetical protein